jgi:hypothetical protein
LSLSKENLRKKYNFVKLDIKIPIKIKIDGYTEKYNITISDLLFAVLKDENKVMEAVAEIKGIEIRKIRKYNY